MRLWLPATHLEAQLRQAEARQQLDARGAQPALLMAPQGLLVLVVRVLHERGSAAAVGGGGGWGVQGGERGAVSLMRMVVVGVNCGDERGGGGGVEGADICPGLMM